MKIYLLIISSANAAAAAASMNNSAGQTASKSNNAAILSLLNSSPANLTQQKNQSRRISLNAASIPQRVLGHGNVITVPSTTGQVYSFIIKSLFYYLLYIFLINLA
jgi:hypothetical protein